MAGVTDEQDVVVLLCKRTASRCTLFTSGQVASMVFRGGRRLRKPLPGTPVRREHGHGTFGDFVHFINEDSALLLQGLHHVAVVNNRLRT